MDDKGDLRILSDILFFCLNSYLVKQEEKRKCHLKGRMLTACFNYMM